VSAAQQAPAPPRAGAAGLVAFLTSPGEAIRDAAAAPSFVAGPLLALCAAGVAGLLASLVERTPPAAVGALAITGGLLVRVPASGALLFFAAVFVHFFAQALGGGAHARGGRLFGMLAACRMPLVLSLPLALLLRGASELTGVAFPPGFFLMLLELWSLALMVGAVRELYGISTGAALLSFLFPGLLVAAGSALVASDWFLRSLVFFSTLVK